MSSRQLGREIVVALGLKLAALVALFALFFAPSMRTHVDPEAMGKQVLSEERTP